MGHVPAQVGAWASSQAGTSVVLVVVLGPTMLVLVALVLVVVPIAVLVVVGRLVVVVTAPSHWAAQSANASRHSVSDDPGSARHASTHAGRPGPGSQPAMQLGRSPAALWAHSPSAMPQAPRQA
jgi:predicted Co/Zn/Cd cation transporter (cation efflux family)